MKALDSIPALVRGHTYWVEHPRYGTIEAKLLVVSGNKGSLGFLLSQPVALPCVVGGFAITRLLALVHMTDCYQDIVTNTPWAIHERAPAAVATPVR